MMLSIRPPLFHSKPRRHVAHHVFTTVMAVNIVLYWSKFRGLIEET